MRYRVLKRGSKYTDAVRALQDALMKLGCQLGSIDGVFGPDTEAAVKHFQQTHGLDPDGIVGQNTWEQIERTLGPPAPAELPLPSWILDGFHGDAHWIHEWEGHKGYPYWPGGSSGVTIDPGVDIGQMTDRLVPLFVDLYDNYLTPVEIGFLLGARHVVGVAARGLAADPQMKAIKISRSEAAEVFPYTLDPYWDRLKERFDPLIEAPGAVQTVFLSLGYNRGPDNVALDVLREPLVRKNYDKIGNLVMSMQQDHPLIGIQQRRRAEGRLILENL